MRVCKGRFDCNLPKIFYQDFAITAKKKGLQKINFGIETKGFLEFSIIRTPLHYRQFVWSQKCQKSYIPYLYNTDTSVKQTLGSVPLVSVLKRFDCIPDCERLSSFLRASCG